MLNWLRKHFSPAQPAAAAPQTSPAAQGATASDYLRREPILSREHVVCGYELSLERPHMQRQRHPSAWRFFDAALLDRLLTGDLAGILGRRLAFLPVHPLSLDLPQLARLTPGNIVLSIQPVAVAAETAEAVVETARHLKRAGLSLACGPLAEGDPLAPLLEIASYLVLDARLGDPAVLMELQRRYARAYPDAKLVVRHVDDLETFHACKSMAFHYFQGGYVTRQRDWKQPRADSSRLVVAQLIAQIRQEPDNLDQLALLARLDPVLAFRLLRYVNSAAMGLRNKIASLQHAITYIGLEGLYRWLTLLLFYSGKTQPLDEALREAALARGRLTELLALRRLPRAQGEMAFTIGLLSLMDVLFEMPAEEALAQLSLPDEVQAALLRREGVYGGYLSLAIACEGGDAEQIANLAAGCGLDPATVSACHLEALVWAVEFTDNLRTGL